MPYYRHNSEKILYRLPDNPFVKEETHKRKFAGWKISASLEFIYADNPTNPKTGRLTYPENKAAVTFLEPHYRTEKEAVDEFFSRWHPPDSTKITAEEFEKLRLEYAAIRSKAAETRKPS